MYHAGERDARPSPSKGQFMLRKVIDFDARAKKRGPEISNMSPKQARVFERHGRFCHYCGSQSSLVLDHIVPKSRGGCNSEHNLIPCCFSCNSSKGVKEYQDFLEWMASERVSFEMMIFCGDCI